MALNLSGMLAQPPRDVPLTVRARVLLGGFLNQFGWFFLGFGMIFGWAFGLQADLASLWLFRGELQTVEARVVNCKETSFSVAGDEHRRGTPVYAIHYTFEVTGETFAGVSYATGQTMDPGVSVQVEYPGGQPEISRIRGMRRAPVGAWGAFVFFFPLVGLVFVLAGLRRGVRAAHLLRYGELAAGTLQSKQPTNTRINNRVVYKLTFTFQAQDGLTYEAVAKTHMPEKLENEPAEPLLYDPGRPSYCVMLDNLPGTPRIDSQGFIRPGSARKTLTTLLIPAATLIGHGTFAYLRFLR